MRAINRQGVGLGAKVGLASGAVVALALTLAGLLVAPGAGAEPLSIGLVAGCEPPGVSLPSVVSILDAELYRISVELRAEFAGSDRPNLVLVVDRCVETPPGTISVDAISYRDVAAVRVATEVRAGFAWGSGRGGAIDHFARRSHLGLTSDALGRRPGRRGLGSRSHRRRRLRLEHRRSLGRHQARDRRVAFGGERRRNRPAPVTDSRLHGRL
jgi:hypothetical protein